jgi:hypothetical protein
MTDFRELCAELLAAVEHEYGDPSIDRLALSRRARAALAEGATTTAKPESTIKFRLGNAPAEIIRIDQQGFHYKGQLIEDAGEAHRLFVEFLKTNTHPRPIPVVEQ